MPISFETKFSNFNFASATPIKYNFANIFPLFLLRDSQTILIYSH